MPFAGIIADRLARSRRRTLECGDLSPLWISRPFFTTQKESGDKSPHSKLRASRQQGPVA
jgi:hypothetical protein